MLRSAFSAVRCIRPLSFPYFNTTRIIANDFKNYSIPTTNHFRSISNTGLIKNSLLNGSRILDISSKIVCVPVRTVTKFSMNKGKRKTVKAVTRRFFRLHWGGWIRPKVGRHKKLWKKSPAQKRRLRQHVFCTATQSNLLDKMVTKFWKRPKHYVDNPYTPYHTREEFSITRQKPVVKN